MAVHVGNRRGKVFYFFHMHPEDFALGMYSVIMSLLGSNLLWVYALLLCLSLDQLNIAYVINRLLAIQITFASVTTFLWWLLYSEKGKSVTTHIIFYSWFGAKIMAAMLDIIFFSQLYLRTFQQTSPGDFDIVIDRMAWGGFMITALEILGLFYAHKYFKSQRKIKCVHKKRKAYLSKTLTV